MSVCVKSNRAGNTDCICWVDPRLPSLSQLSFSQLKNGMGLTLLRGDPESTFKSFGQVLNLLFGIYSSAQKSGAAEPKIILQSSFQSGNFSETIRNAQR